MSQYVVEDEEATPTNILRNWNAHIFFQIPVRMNKVSHTNQQVQKIYALKSRH